MNGLLNNNKQLNSYLIGLAGATGIISIFAAIRQHYLRLKKQAKKQVQSGAISDTNSENLSRNDNIKPVVEEISDQIIEKIVDKIKNSIIHSACICIDKIKDPKMVQEQKDESIMKSGLINDATSQIIKDDEIVIEEQSMTTKLPELENNQDKDMVELIATIESKQDFLPDFERNLFAYNQVMQGNPVMSCKYTK
jgi:hypothetical protein